MSSLVAVLPLVVIAVIAALVVRSALRGRVAWTPRPRKPRPARPAKSTLRVSRAQIDKDLDELIRRR